jgi:hypothetical protein
MFMSCPSGMTLVGKLWVTLGRNDHNKHFMVYLNEVLYVPLLSRRLFSLARVEQVWWNDQLHDGPLSHRNTKRSKNTQTVGVDPMCAEEAVNQEQAHTVTTNVDLLRRHKPLLPEWITLTWWGGLLHQRMETKNSQNAPTCTLRLERTNLHTTT